MEGDDGVRVGKQRRSMSKNPLLQRPKLGKPNKPMSKEAAYITHGVTSKPEAGAAACMHWAQQGPHNIDKTLGQSMKAPLSARSRKRIDDVSHGMKNVKGDTAGDLFGSWPADQSKGRSTHTPVGKRTGKFAVAGATELTHGLSTVPREPGAETAMGGWHGGVAGEGRSASALRKKKDPVPDIMFGRSSVREMGVSELIGHQYGRGWIEEVSRPASSASRATTSQSQSRSEYNHGGEFPSRPPTGASSRPGSSRPTSTRAASSRSKTYRDVQEERMSETS